MATFDYLISDSKVEGWFDLYVQSGGMGVNASGRADPIIAYASRFTQEEIDKINNIARTQAAVNAAIQAQKIADKKRFERPKHEELVQEQTKIDEKANKQIESSELSKGGSPSAASQQDWDGAWKDKQMEEQLKSTGIKEPTHPEPLLVDKISSLPPGSPRRNCYENIKGVVENSTANIGSGTDTVTRESYKELQMLVKASPMLSEGVNPSSARIGAESTPPPSKEDLLGVENGKMVTNLQAWQATLSNAVKPVSDAIGSHADASSSVNKSQMGPDQMMPQTMTAQAQSITPAMVTDVENPFKATQKSNLLQTPAKSVGSLRQLMTCSIPSLSVPFDLLSDVYGGLMNLIKQVSKLLDATMAAITKFAISAVGGLIDGIFPAGLLQKLIAFVTKIAGMISFLFNLLAGLSALKKTSEQIAASLPLGCTTNIFDSQRQKASTSSKTNKFAQIAATAGAVAGAAGAVGAVVGSLPNLGSGLGNLSIMIGGGVPKDLGNLTASITHPKELLSGMFADKINSLLKNLPWCCAVGCTGDNGFSIGTSFDGLNDNAFTKSMNSWAAHASIISPNFNKKSTPVGSFATKDVIPSFDKLPFGTNAEGAKGVIMYAAGATAKRKVFKL